MTGAPWTMWRDRHRVGPGRARGVAANSLEVLLPVIVQEPGLTTQALADRVGMRRQNVNDTLRQLHQRGLVTSRVELYTDDHGRGRERGRHFPTPLADDVVRGRDHPGTPLGLIRAALAERPRSLLELTALLPLPPLTLRTVLRLLVIQGDLERHRDKDAERFRLPALLDDDDDPEAGDAAAPVPSLSYPKAA